MTQPFVLTSVKWINNGDRVEQQGKERKKMHHHRAILIFSTEISIEWQIESNERRFRISGICTCHCGIFTRQN